MTLENLNNGLQDYKKGTYFGITFETLGKNGSKKIVEMLGRFVAYMSISNKPRPSGDEKIGFVQLHINKDGTKTEKILLHTTNNKSATKSTYYNGNGQEITRDEYLEINPSKPSTFEGGVFSKKLCDIIEIRYKGKTIR